MAVTVTHAKVATLPDEPGAEVNKAEWNDNHVVLGLGSAAEAATTDFDAAGTATAAIAAHEAAPDPHPGYLTPAEGNAVYDAIGAAAAGDAAHVAAGDPHTQYQKESEKDAANGYAGLDGTTKVPTAELGTGVADSSTFLRGDRTWSSPGAGSTNIKATTVTVSSPAFEASFTVVDTDVSAGSQIIIDWGNCTQSDMNHPSMGQVAFNAIPGTGQFTAELFSLDQSKLFGPFNLNYLVG